MPNEIVVKNQGSQSRDRKAHLKVLLEPFILFYSMNKYSKTFNLSLGSTLLSFLKCVYFLWISFPLLVPLYVFWPSSLEKFKNKFDSRKLMSFYNNPLYWGHLIPHEFSIAKQKYVRHILDLIPQFSKNQNMSILEVGCGVGSYTSHLSKIGEVTAIDISKQSLRLIHFRIQRNVNTVRSSAATLPFYAGNFDLVICMDVLEHIADPKNVVVSIMDNLNHANGILIANYDIDTPEKDHIGELSQQDFEIFLYKNYHIINKVKFEIGSVVYVISNKK